MTDYGYDGDDCNDDDDYDDNDEDAYFSKRSCMCICMVYTPHAMQKVAARPVP